MTPKVMTISNPDFFNSNLAKELFERAFQETGYLTPSNALVVCQRCCVSPLMQILVGWEDNEAKALIITLCPVSALVTRPYLYHMYNGGSETLRKTMLAEVVDWLQSKGYNEVLATYWGTHSDAVWKRQNKSFGKVDRVGRIFHVTFPEKDKEAA